MKSARLKVPLGIVITLIVGILVYGVYSQQHNKVANLNAQFSSLQTSISASKQQLITTNNLNDGVVTATSAVTSNTVSLLSGKVTFTLPSGWVQATASKYAQQCYIGGLAQWYCLDTTTIVPKDLNSNSSTSTYDGINVAVYENNSSSPVGLYNNELSGSGTAGDKYSTLTIDGYSSYYINTAGDKLIYGDQFNDEYYIIASKSYVVLITSDVNNNAGPNGATKFNDNSQYSPTVRSFAESLKIQGN